jgi:hypothetical protein
LKKLVPYGEKNRGSLGVYTPTSKKIEKMGVLQKNGEQE